MKLHQEEYCHHCSRYVQFEFDDEEYRQVIICPVCGHEHYRELDPGTIINIRMNPDSRVIKIAKMDTSGFFKMSDSEVCNLPNITYEEREILSKTEEGMPVVKTKENEKPDTKIVSRRRWGTSNTLP